MDANGSGLPIVVSLPLLLLLLLGITLLWLEARHRLRPASPLRLIPGSFTPNASPADPLLVNGEVILRNPHPRMEVMVPEFKVKPILLGNDDIGEVATRTSITAQIPDEDPRPDRYWVATIVKGRKSIGARIQIALKAPAGIDLRQRLDTLWIDIRWVDYGPFGRLPRRQGLLIPLRRPEPLDPVSASWRDGERCRVLPIPTHLLGVMDDPMEVLEHYAGGLIQPGDILTIGETPLAVMQGRYHHPETVRPGCLARLLCRVFHPTSSLATACGMQTLIDIVGPARVLCAWIAGFALRLVGSRGGFYRLAGDQARLIDDITGTTPPYDQTIVLGPEHPQTFCRQAASLLGVAVAVVDVNDLGRVKVLAGSPGCDEPLLQRALRPNPAGNADQRTPLVLVRPA
jgi:hypothetical protein